MPRRAFLLAAGAAALCVVRMAGGQTGARVPRVVFLTVGTTQSPQFAALRRRFLELGYVEGKNFVLDARALDGQWERLPSAAAEVARTAPDVVIAPGSELLLKAVRQAVGATPIVMIAIDFDPVEKNYISSLARPGGNITGLFFRQIETARKRLELLKQTLPQARRVAALFDHSTRDQLSAAEQTAGRLGVTLLPQQLRGSSYDFDAALVQSASANAQAVLALSSAAFFVLREKFIAAAHRHRLPVIANPNYAEAGALVSFGASYPHMYARAAEYGDRILKGANPAHMPVEQASNYELIVNLRSARLLGVNVPQPVLVRATRIIE